MRRCRVVIKIVILKLLSASRHSPAGSPAVCWWKRSWQYEWVSYNNSREKKGKRKSEWRGGYKMKRQQKVRTCRQKKEIGGVVVE